MGGNVPPKTLPAAVFLKCVCSGGCEPWSLTDVMPACGCLLQCFWCDMCHLRFPAQPLATTVQEQAGHGVPSYDVFCADSIDFPYPFCMLDLFYVCCGSPV